LRSQAEELIELGGCLRRSTTGSKLRRSFGLSLRQVVEGPAFFGIVLLGVGPSLLLARVHACGAGLSFGLSRDLALHSREDLWFSLSSWLVRPAPECQTLSSGAIGVSSSAASRAVV
jgi:hypothetical protein